MEKESREGRIFTRTLRKRASGARIKEGGKRRREKEKKIVGTYSSCFFENWGGRGSTGAEGEGTLSAGARF